MANCYAEQNAQLQPAMRLVSAITQASNASVTTSFAHGYSDGLKVRLYVPSYYGMSQIDKKVGVVTVTGNTTFTVDIDSLSYEAFAAPVAAWYHNKCALVIPVTGKVKDVS